MITEEQITAILKSKQTVNEYYPCVTFHEYEEVSNEILKLVDSSDDIQNVINSDEDSTNQHYIDLQECCHKILNSIEEGRPPQKEIIGLRLLLNR